jgi:hypothetical protein
VLRELAAATGMVGSYGAPFPFQGGTYGAASFRKNKPVRSYKVALPAGRGSDAVARIR